MAEPDGTPRTRTPSRTGACAVVFGAYWSGARLHHADGYASGDLHAEGGVSATWQGMADVLTEIKSALDDLEYLTVESNIDSDCGIPALIVRGNDGDLYRVSARPVHD